MLSASLHKIFLSNTERNVLLNDALIFYLRLYGVDDTAKDNSDIKRANQLSSIHERFCLFFVLLLLLCCCFFVGFLSIKETFI